MYDTRYLLRSLIRWGHHRTVKFRSRIQLDIPALPAKFTRHVLRQQPSCTRYHWRLSRFFTVHVRRQPIHVLRVPTPWPRHRPRQVQRQPRQIPSRARTGQFPWPPCRVHAPARPRERTTHQARPRRGRGAPSAVRQAYARLQCGSVRRRGTPAGLRRCVVHVLGGGRACPYRHT